jgi:hypothetical protein
MNRREILTKIHAHPASPPLPIKKVSPYAVMEVSFESTEETENPPKILEKPPSTSDIK